MDDGGAAAPDFNDIALDTETVFDGGFLPGGSDFIVNELLKDIDELSTTEARLRREGAMMVLEKIRLGSIRDDLPPADLPPAPVGGEKMSVIAKKLAGRNGPTVWGEFGALAAQTKGVNLGQGFPNWDPPQFVRDAAIEAIMEGSHQYTRSAGHPSLISLLAARYSMHLGRSVQPESEVAVTVGASQALFVSLQVLIEQDDEVILMEPFFDLYLGQIRLAGGTPRFVPLEVSSDGAWTLDIAKLRAAITPKTRVLILNSPHNPTGKVFTHDELRAIAEVVRENPRVWVISDEVYKYIVHSPPAQKQDAGKLASGGHSHFANMPGMWERTLTVSSAGKTFSVTGWQVGWVVGPSKLVRDIQTLLPYVQFCAATPMQEALTRVLRKADQPYEGSISYYDHLRSDYKRKRDLLAEALEAGGIIPMRGEGGFFLIGDTRNLKVPSKYLEESTPAIEAMSRDWALCRWLAIEHGVCAIPCSPFYSPENRHLAQNFVRFAFCKTDETLLAAKVALSKVPRQDPIE